MMRFVASESDLKCFIGKKVREIEGEPQHRPPQPGENLVAGRSLESPRPKTGVEARLSSVPEGPFQQKNRED